MKKFIFFVSLFAILLTCATLAVHAEEVAVEATGEVIVTELPDAELPDAELPSDDITEEELPEEVTVIADEVKELILSHANEIISAITLAVSVVLAWLYKKGVLPNIINGFNGISKVLTTFKDSMTGIVAENKKDVNAAVVELKAVMNKFADMKESYDHLQGLYEGQEQEKAKLESKIKRSDDINLLIATMLKEVFINTNAPQYMKDNFNTYYAKMLAVIGAEPEVKAVSDDEKVA